MDALPITSVYVSSASQSSGCELTASQVHSAFGTLKSRLAGTSFISAKASQVCGFIRVDMADGKVAYADRTGRYFILGMVLDTQTGGPADGSKQLDVEHQLLGH